MPLHHHQQTERGGTDHKRNTSDTNKLRLLCQHSMAIPDNEKHTSVQNFKEDLFNPDQRRSHQNI